MSIDINQTIHKENNYFAVCNHKLKNDDDLIDLDEALPNKPDSKWLMECTGKKEDFQDSFSKLHFSNPTISLTIKSAYQSGKSTQVLRHLLFNNENISASCGNCGCLYRESNLSSKQSNGSITDSLDSLSLGDNTQRIPFGKRNKMTVKSKAVTPTISSFLPIVKNTSSSQNALSRTYDKEDLEILKEKHLSKSLIVPHINRPNSTNMKRAFPIVSDINPRSNVNYTLRPTSTYQIEKLDKDSNDKFLKINQIKRSNLNRNSGLKMNRNLTDIDVVTTNHLLKKPSVLRRSNTCRK